MTITINIQITMEQENKEVLAVRLSNCDMDLRMLKSKMERILLEQRALLKLRSETKESLNNINLIQV